jgi:hypothetical protein
MRLGKGRFSDSASGAAPEGVHVAAASIKSSHLFSRSVAGQVLRSKYAYFAMEQRGAIRRISMQPTLEALLHSSSLAWRCGVARSSRSPQVMELKHAVEKRPQAFSGTMSLITRFPGLRLPKVSKRSLLSNSNVANYVVHMAE